MEGDTFEMEDQRNWTDASYKTYCRPLARGFPFPVAAGETVEQTVEIRLLGSAPGGPGVATRPPVTFAWDQTARGLPSLGLGMASHGEPMSEEEARPLRALRPAHLRVDLHTGTSPWPGRLEQADLEAAALDAGLELAVHLGEDAEGALGELAARTGALRSPVRRGLVFHEGEPSEGGQP